MRKLALKYGCAHVTISRWVMAHKKYGKKQPLQASLDVLKPGAAMPEDVGELKAALRLALIKVEFLETMIDISDEEFGTNIRKKAGTGQS
jgi:hypothetical protein